jgi:hypothetical protein
MRTFIGFGQSAYIGTPQALSIKLGGIAAQVVPLLFQWLSYGAGALVPNVNVLVDLRSQSCVKLDQIRSVYIDNLGSNIPVYVYFPDTNYTIVAKPNSEGWYPAFTNAKVCWVIGEGFTAANIPQTSIILSNVGVQPSVNTEINNDVMLYLASASISRGSTIYNQNFGTPALGDQTQQVAFTLGAGTLSPTLFLGPYTSGFIYMTALSIMFQGLAIAAPSANIVLESTGISGLLYQFLASPPTAAGINNIVTYQLSNKNIKLDATQTWRFRSTVASAGGSVFCAFDYTTNPF